MKLRSKSIGPTNDFKKGLMTFFVKYVFENKSHGKFIVKVKKPLQDNLIFL